MLQTKNISKQYKTGDLVQTALDGVSLNLRDNEFVAILGPSGSGKTTLLNVIGGLDRYDSGDLVINGISTKKYKDKDWDSYRNHTIGFVFQSYNLIPHQSVLSNVELALTISGVSRAERKKRAKAALEEVGLGDQIHKKPNQMSGGQMQRVAIARALVNDPDILLADEPTGALDTETSVQVMELLKKVANKRLVVMVTHNPELAEQYATRIVRLRDGKIIDDTDPFEVNEQELAPPKHENMGKSSMSWFTALSLSFNNLRTKKARTFLTSFAGSIGIIGIALILSLSAGVNTYIENIQKDTMTSYPITIEAQTIDLTEMMETAHKNTSGNIDHDKDAVYSNSMALDMASSAAMSFTENNLSSFKKYLDNPESEIHSYVGENGIIYSYNTKFSVYAKDPEGIIVNTDGVTIGENGSKNSMMMSGMTAMGSMMNQTSKNFTELIPDRSGNGISSAVTENFELLYGSWPSEYNQVVLQLDENNEIQLNTLYELGLLPSAKYDEMMKSLEAGEEFNTDTVKLNYEDICSKEFYLVPSCDQYKQNENGTFTKIRESSDSISNLMEDAVKLSVVGIIRPTEDGAALYTGEAVGYTRALTNYLIDHADNSAIVKAQKDSKDINVLNGMTFSPEDDSVKISDTKTYLKNLGVTEKANMCADMINTLSAANPQAASQMSAMTEEQLAASLDAYTKQADDEFFLNVYENYISSGNFDDNMTDFGAISLDAPSSISIYSDSFENKDNISNCIQNYNTSVSDENQITYTDYVGLLMSSVTTIINIISYVLIAFVAVSLVVSSIMIGIITYISVLERTKEIGVLRAIGASKHNISQVFNAETFIIGLLSGLIGIGVSLVLTIPINAIIHALADSNEVNAHLPVAGAVILVILSMLLTLIGGLIPAKKAAKKDPVIALRSE